MRLFELITTDLLIRELLPVNFLPPKELPENVLTLKLLRGDLVTLKVILGLRIVRRLEPVLRVRRKLDLTVLLEVIRPDGLEVLGLARCLVDRGAAVTLVRVLLIFEGRLTLGAGELFLTR